MEKKTALITGSYGGLGTCFVNIHAGTARCLSSSLSAIQMMTSHSSKECQTRM